MQSGQFEVEETRIVHELLGDVDVLINIGANIGYYCCIALERKKRVIAFEPLPRNLEFLMKNVTLNGMEDLRPQRQQGAQKHHADQWREVVRSVRTHFFLLRNFRFGLR